ncbi:MAG: carboxypeptidase-like regulatory domain-containing protein [Candidatus Thermoplasmatota archaeon]|nr:carboxypeptidase regulatory-like domain-containing protein [Euryarchaeota archaeon]MBU4033102.1 carboxypeptidase-like regulatory domain-containing protein [Candidatus Thermoplasmatota archaeon]MBU4072341.1 carboxypeptidase-like regulatory domain-containing protein [Candidatus Thermoplasmatota archaeon]MBU4143627.1 carboxypeptidase-like regulatory domain-containing protein [Candidatus Thermoplasmatota archaeon]MBU4591287.1 carboxypeptidase-like regulatory domain-containing protein [Candidatus
MAHALWRGILVILLLSSICAVPVLATSLTVETALNDETVYPGDEAVVTGTVKDSKNMLVADATVEIIVEKTNITVNTTTDDKGMFVASFNAPLALGEYSINVSAFWSIYSGNSILFLTVMAPPPPAPDICVQEEDISFWSDAFETGSKVLVNTTVRNIGELDANTTVKLFLGTPFQGELLFSERIVVPANGSNIVGVLWVAESGIHLFTVVADQVEPSDRNITNNQANNTIEIQDTFPPVISEPQISLKEPTSEDIVSVLALVEDDLGLAKDKPVTLIFSVGDADEEELSMNETKDGFLGDVGPFPGGTFVLLKVRALDLSGNMAETEWYRRDIYYSSIKVTVENVTSKPGRELSIKCSAVYEDGSNVFGQEAVLVLEGVEYLSTTNDMGEAHFNITTPTEPGEYDFTVFINEKRLAANSSAILTILPVYPDVLIIQNGIAFSWVNVSKVEVTIVLYNRGEASGDVHLEVFQGLPSNGVLLNSTNFTINTDQFYFHSFFWYPQSGHHTLVVVANCSEDLEPWNNIATAEVTIPIQENNVIADDNTTGDDSSLNEEEAGSNWTMGQMLLSLGLGILLSVLVMMFITKFIARRKSE